MASRVGTMEEGVVEEAAPVSPPKLPESPEQPVAEAPEDEDESLPEDPNEEIVPGGPTWGQIDAWKKEFGDVYITSFTADKHVVWRTLNRFEYKRLVKSMEMSLSTGQVTQAEANFNNEELMCEMCVLYPKMAKSDMSSDQAGVASIISQEIMEASGFVALNVRQV